MTLITITHRHTRTVCIAILGTLALFPSSLFAWHKFGHMEVALIAYDELAKNNPQLCKKLVGILRHHPRFALDFQMPLELNADQQDQWIFCQAAAWPDTVRPGPGAAIVPPSLTPDPAHKTTYHRDSWHYINTPFAIPADQEQMLEHQAAGNLNLDQNEPAAESLKFNAIQALKYNTHVLTTSNDPAAQAVALCWILHIAGDLHQPLHCIALFTPRRFEPGPGKKASGDRGGNSIKWDDSENGNIHWRWDDAPGTNSAASYAHVRAGASRLSQQADLAKAATATDPSAWANESYDLAKSAAYTDEIRKQIMAAEADVQKLKVIQTPSPADYENAVRDQANRRAAQGGVRAGAWLAAHPAK